MPIDVLIVGQGLAGSLLAWELLHRRCRIMVIDNGDENASQVAAGLINPVTGQRLVKAPELEQLLPVAMACYQKLAEEFKQPFFMPLPMLRVLKSEREQQLARKRLEQSNYQPYLQNTIDTVDGIDSPHGLLRQQQTGYLKTQALLEQLRSVFIANACYRQTQLEYREIVLQPHLQWRDVQPRHIVFCEGYRAVDNPWFGKLPFQSAKGEILLCRSPVPCPPSMLNYGNWLIPIDTHDFKIGATFEPAYQTLQPTIQARSQLLNNLAGVCPDRQPVEVVEHRAGIRPTTRDKQPFIGVHPRHAQLHIFNGFGAKGSLSIPWYAQQFANALQQQTSTMPATSHVQRYYDSHFPV